MHQASVGFHCPDCSKAGAQKVIRGPAAFSSRPVVTQVLIGINGAVFVLGIIFAGGGRAISNASGELFQRGALYGPLVTDEPWRLVTGAFLHAGLFHLALNMYALWILGQLVERTAGPLRFALIYGVALLTGSLGALLVTPNSPTVGASGAIFGLMGAALAIAMARGIRPAETGLLGILGLNLAFTFLIPGISIGGHIGGLAGGFIAGWLLFDAPARLKVRNPVVPAAVCAVIGAAAVIVSVAAMSARFG